MALAASRAARYRHTAALLGRKLAVRMVSERRYVPLFWRLFIPNACVLAAACLILIIEPANGQIPALVGGLTVMLAVNLVLMRRATGPLTRLIAVMRHVDPLRPGQRIAAAAAPSEVTVLSQSFNEMLDRIETERRESARRELLVQEGERRRVAAELHDEIGQSVTALVLELDRSIGDAPEDRRAALLRSRDVAAQLLEDVRRLARSLRPEVLDELGLAPALTNLCDRLSAQTGLEIKCSLSDELPPLGPEVQLVIYRVIQESLTNVVRHARAGRAHVALACSDGLVELEVVDDGVGIGAAAGSGGGIRGMRERALLVGGVLDVEPAAPGGTRVRLRIPVQVSSG
jgi:two-component system, NarL family, sensor histidine kinase UhpB